MEKKLPPRPPKKIELIKSFANWRFGVACLVWLAPLAVSAQQSGHPYTATKITAITRIGADGSPVHETITEKLARDGAGRTYTETTTSAGRQVILIDDVKAKLTYTLYPDTMTGEQWSYTTFPRYAAYSRPEPNLDAFSLPPGVPRPALVTTELGTRRIDGLDARGERSTLTLPPGATLNGKKLQTPVTLVTETWAAPGFGVIEQTRGSSSDSAPTVEIHWQDVKLGEPPAALFATGSYELVSSAYTPARIAGMFSEAKADLASLPPGLAAEALVRVAEFEPAAAAASDAQAAFRQALTLPPGVYRVQKDQVEARAIGVVLAANVDDVERTRIAIRMAQQGDGRKSFLYDQLLMHRVRLTPPAAAAAGFDPAALALQCYQADGSFPYNGAFSMVDAGDLSTDSRRALLREAYSAAVHDTEEDFEPLQLFQLGHALDPELDDELVPAIDAVLARFTPNMNYRFAGEYLKLLQQIAPGQAANWSQLAAQVAVKTAGMRPLPSPLSAPPAPPPQPDPATALASALAQPNPDTRLWSLVSFANRYMQSDANAANQAADAALGLADPLSANDWGSVTSAASLAGALSQLGRTGQATTLAEQCLDLASQQAEALDARYESQPPQDISAMQFNRVSADSIVNLFQSLARTDFDAAATHAENLQAPLLKPIVLAAVASQR